MDMPLIAEVRHLLKIQRGLGGEPVFLWNTLANTSDSHDFAACFLALWVYLGYYPITTTNYACNSFIRAGIAIAEMHSDKVLAHVDDKLAKVSRNIGEPIQNRLTTPVLDNGAYSLGMSDLAKRMAKIDAELGGAPNVKRYVGARFVQPKRKSGLHGVYGVRRNQNVIGW